MDTNIMDIIQSASGRDEKGLTKSSVAVFYDKIKEDGSSKIPVENVAVDKPVVNVHKNLHNIFVDLTFPTHMDTDLAILNKILIRAFDAQNSYIPGKTDVPLITVSVVPHAYEGRFYLLMSDPIFWALTSDSPSGQMNIIRFVFSEDDFYVMAASDETLAELNDQIEAELSAQERQQAFYAEKEAERKRAAEERYSRMANQ